VDARIEGKEIRYQLKDLLLRCAFSVFDHVLGVPIQRVGFRLDDCAVELGKYADAIQSSLLHAEFHVWRARNLVRTMIEEIWTC
jgi:hypothetical protein